MAEELEAWELVYAELQKTRQQRDEAIALLLEVVQLTPTRGLSKEWDDWRRRAEKAIAR